MRRFRKLSIKSQIGGMVHFLACDTNNMQYLRFFTLYFQQKSFRLGIIVLGIVILAVACNNTPAQSVCVDICVDPLFQAFYEEHGGERIFGKPYTELLTDPTSGLKAQYFESARLEIMTTTSDDITIAELGRWQYDGLDNPIEANIPLTNPYREFSGNIILQGAFLEFYEMYGGEEIFGLPISNQLNEGDARVQYFENFRLVWHPDAPVGLQIQVGETGRAHYMYEVYDPQRIGFIPIDDERLNSAEVTAAVSSPILYGDDAQTIFVLAESSNLKPIEGLEVALTISHNGNTYKQKVEGLTNPQGTLQAVIEVDAWVPGESVHVDISVSYPGEPPIGTTSITFQTWW